MRVHIVGSLPRDVSDQDAERMKSDCISIGEELGSSNSELSIGSVREHTADLHVLRGFLSKSHEKKVCIFHRSADGALHSEIGSLEAEFDFKFSAEVTNGTNATRHVAAMREATALLIIGGKGGTATAGYIAPMLGKPVLALPNFGGAGKEIWDALQYTYGQSALTQSSLADLEKANNDELAGRVVSALKLLISSNPFKSSVTKAQWIFNALVGVCLFLWAFIFSIATKIDPYAAVFCLMMLSSLVGTSLRTLLRVYFDMLENFSPRRTFSDLMIGIVITFGFFLLFFAGGGIYNLPASQVITSENIIQTSVFLSLIGLGASFLLERSIAQFRTRVARTIEDDNGQN